MKRIQILYSLVILISLCSCVKSDDITIDNINELKIGSSSMKSIVVYADMDVVNRAPLSAKLKEAELVVYNNDKKFATIKLMKAVKIRKGVNENLILPVGVQISGGLLSLAFMKLDTKSMSVDIYAKFSAPFYRKTVNLKRVPLSELSQNGDGAQFLESIENLF